MHIKWLIIGLVTFSLIGSIAWAMPTPMQRAQGKLRAMAMQKGIRVNIAQLHFPRECGHVEADKRLATSYTLFRNNDQIKAISKSTKSCNWQVFRINGLETDGLPEGWCWQPDSTPFKNTLLNNTQLEKLTQLIEKLPKDVYSIFSNTGFVAIYWNEQGTPEDVEVIYQVLQILKEGL